jgi:hypothetical protein
MGEEGAMRCVIVVATEGGRRTVVAFDGPNSQPERPHRAPSTKTKSTPAMVDSSEMHPLSLVPNSRTSSALRHVPWNNAICPLALGVDADMDRPDSGSAPPCIGVTHGQAKLGDGHPKSSTMPVRIRSQMDWMRRFPSRRVMRSQQPLLRIISQQRPAVCRAGPGPGGKGAACR